MATTVERGKVIELAKTMPSEKLVSWYEYGLFIQNREGLDDLHKEFARWEQASEEDSQTFERKLEEF
jgi:hypothetical protein